MSLVLNKKYKLASSENFDEVMKALGMVSLRLYFVLVMLLVCYNCVRYAVFNLLKPKREREREMGRIDEE
jgi:hypothetical protein